MPQLTKNRTRKGKKRGRRGGKEAGREGHGTYVALAAGTHFTIKFSTLPKLLLTQEAVCARVTSDT